MKKRELLLPTFIIFVLLSFNPMIKAGDFTATAIIRVLPYVERDPFVFQTPPIDKDIQNNFRNSFAKLIKQPNVLREVLVERDTIHQTDWFKKHSTAFNNTLTIYLGSADKKLSINFEFAMNDLQKNLKVSTEPNDDLITISMTCNDEKGAAIIVNEIVDILIKTRINEKNFEIMERIRNLNENRASVERDLATYQTSMRNILATTGFTNLETSDIQQPIVVRLNRLMAEKDDCFLEIKQIEKEIEISKSEPNKPNLNGELKIADRKLKILKGKLEELEKMCKEAEEKKRQWDMAHRQYKECCQAKEEQSNNILKELKVAITKLEIMLNEPDSLKSNLQIVKSAAFD